MKNLFGVLAPVSAIVLSTTLAHADLSALTPPSGTTLGINPADLGFTFTPSVPIKVTALGFWDEGTDGFATSGGLNVSIYPDVGNSPNTASALFSANVTSSDTLVVNGYRYHTLATPVVLSAGTTYVIGGYSADDAWRWWTPFTLQTVDPNITFGESRYNRPEHANFPGGYPGNHWESENYAGPNFQFTAVPEASTWVAGLLLLVPFAAQGIRAVRNSKKVAW